MGQVVLDGRRPPLGALSLGEDLLQPMGSERAERHGEEAEHGSPEDGGGLHEAQSAKRSTGAETPRPSQARDGDSVEQGPMSRTEAFPPEGISRLVESSARAAVQG